MSPNLDTLLCERYPKLFADRHNPDSCMSRGFECGGGWFNLIDRLCYRIQFEVDLDYRRQPTVAQVKEKLGGLRIYWQEADEVVRGMTHYAGDLSLVICEVCGAPGEVVGSARRARIVRCQAHRHLYDADAQFKDCNAGPSEGAEEDSLDEL